MRYSCITISLISLEQTWVQGEDKTKKTRQVLKLMSGQQMKQMSRQQMEGLRRQLQQ